jgi:hypothetical protein
MKKLCIAALAAAALFTTTHVAPAQSAFFTYTNVPSGPLAPGATFTIGVTLNFTAGGGITSVNGLSYWMYQQSPTSGFPFSITNRDVTSSLFTDLNSAFTAYPQRLDPISRNPNGTTVDTDLGALGDFNATNGTGTYFVSTLTFSLDLGAAAGIYTIGNTTVNSPNGANFESVVNDANGDATPIGASTFTIAVVPEPSTYALLAVGAIVAGVAVYRRRATAG